MEISRDLAEEVAVGEAAPGILLSSAVEKFGVSKRRP